MTIQFDECTMVYITVCLSGICCINFFIFINNAEVNIFLDKPVHILIISLRSVGSKAFDNYLQITVQVTDQYSLENSECTSDFYAN